MTSDLHYDVIGSSSRSLSNDKCALHHKYFGRLYKTKTIVHNSLFTIERTKCNLSSTIITDFVYLGILFITELAHTTNGVCHFRNEYHIYISSLHKEWFQ